MCVDIFITVLYLELRVCAEVNLYLRKSLAAARVKLVVRRRINSTHGMCACFFPFN